MRQIYRSGHEIASHGYEHRLVYSLTRDEFREDLRRARWALENAAGSSVFGYRAPSYSITRQSLWALDVLIQEGYRYDASIYPIYHDRYGIPEWERHIHRVDRRVGTIWGVPGSTARLGRTKSSVGGGCFRLLPYAWTKRGIAGVNTVEHQPAVFYLHPWEIDPNQPRFEQIRGLARLRHYGNLAKTKGRLRRLVRDFQFGTVDEVLRRLNAPLQASQG